MRNPARSVAALLAVVMVTTAGATDAPLVRIEIPAGSSVKYEWDEATGSLVVDRFLTMPVTYPANYGFVRETLAGDGDPLDVLVFTREPVVPGVLLRVRPIGVLRMTDRGAHDDKLLPEGRNPVELGPMEGAGAAQQTLEDARLRYAARQHGG